MSNHNFYSERNNYLDIRFFGALFYLMVPNPRDVQDDNPKCAKGRRRCTPLRFMEILKDEEDPYDTFEALFTQLSKNALSRFFHAPSLPSLVECNLLQ
jgi:hypothetical protein